jgi:6-phosphogluconolactonase
MLQKALGVVFVLASVAGFISCGTTANHYVFAAIPAANQIAVYREDPNSGVLTQIDGSPYAVGVGPQSCVLHPSGKYLYVANSGQNENDISQFDIASNGTLTEPNSRVSVAPNASQPVLLAIDPAGSFLYVANAQSNNISVFAIDGTSGNLTEVPNSPFSTGLHVLNMQLTPSGNFLYISAAGGISGTTNGSIAGFSVNAGQLASLGVTTSSDGPNPTGLTIDPSGSFLYASNFSSNSISIFAVGSSGSLAKVAGSPIADGYTAPISLILDPAGANLYVANQGSGNVAAYSITSATGLPAALTTSTATNAFGTEVSPSFLASDPSGKYLFVGNQGAGAGIQTFGVSGGTLTALAIDKVGNTVTSIAVLGSGGTSASSN